MRLQKNIQREKQKRKSIMKDKLKTNFMNFKLIQMIMKSALILFGSKMNITH